MVKKKILLIGPMPPPSGGVSVHLERLLQRSKDHPQLTLAVCDLGKLKLFYEDSTKRNFLSVFIFFLSASIIHIHISHPAKIIIARISRLFGKKVFYTLHNTRDLQLKPVKSVIKISDKIIFVVDPGKIPVNGIVIPAYINPDFNLLLPSELETVVKTFNHVIVSVSSHSGKLNDKEDIYGFDIILEAVLKTSFPDKSILIFVDSIGFMKNHYQKIVPEIEITSGIKIMFINSEINFSRLLSLSDIFIRATRSDGDALSVREALQAGTTVLASDCVSRPQGCKLFMSGDSNNLSERLIDVLNNHKKQVFRQEDFASKIFEMYLNEK